MSRSRILSSIAAAALGMALFGACSSESLTERAVGFGLEQAIEGDQDISLDFSDDGAGGFSISTDEGDFAINFDGDDGGIVFNSEDGDGVISFDEDGIVFDTDEGDGVISFDEDGFAFNTDEGNGAVSIDEDTGTVSFQSDDGTSAVYGATEVPDSWPAAIGVPATANPDSTFFSVLDLGTDQITSATFEHAPQEQFAAQVEAALAAAGWTMDIESNDNAGGRYVTFTQGNSFANVSTDGNGFTAVTITVSAEQ